MTWTPDTTKEYLPYPCPACEGKGGDCYACAVGSSSGAYGTGSVYRKNRFFGTWPLNLAPILAGPSHTWTNWNMRLGHWQWGAAMNQPNKWQSHKFQENGTDHEWRSFYRPQEKKLYTNIAGCPWSNHHHIGQLCEICGNDERHIKPLPRKRK